MTRGSAEDAGRAPEFLGRHLETIESRLKLVLEGDRTPLAAAARYVMGWEDGERNQGGKRIRPALCLFAAEEYGGRIEAAIPGAIAVELIHNFSLVHDEIQDQDETRHHRPTVWTMVGQAQAINVGDYLYTRALATLADCAAPAETKSRAISLLMQATTAMLEGQWADLSFENEGFVPVDDYLRMVEGKTGALLGASLAIGALLAGAPADDVERLRVWGVKIGLGFQARDDYLGIWGDPAVTGKPVGNDVARKKKSLPIVHGLTHVGTSAVIRDAFLADQPTAEQVERVVAALELGDIARRCLDQAAQFAEDAQRLLGDTSLNAASREHFNRLGAYFVSRPA